MKVNISRHGTVTLTSESAAEAFFLDNIFIRGDRGRCSRILVTGYGGSCIGSGRMEYNVSIRRDDEYHDTHPARRGRTIVYGEESTGNTCRDCFHNDVPSGKSSVICTVRPGERVSIHADTPACEFFKDGTDKQGEE